MEKSLLEVPVIALLNLAVHVLLKEGYVLHKLNILVCNITDRIFGLRFAAWLQNPLFECYVCMASVWTMVWGWELSWWMPKKMLLVCACSYIIEKLIDQTGKDSTPEEPDRLIITGFNNERKAD